ncbi:hypothetical protein VBP92_27115 [Klebsiella variicola]|jgi:hypothetical protein|uniref:SDH family Clp fold serine proteinase n=1 Tax=Klebsiella variicola TaxID=244366 RepID=UPI002B21F6A2|nr:hypothetical protein [Klebsiella variicola]MEA5495554.1 hypothetical protein [Klebsiella variicola]
MSDDSMNDSAQDSGFPDKTFEKDSNEAISEHSEKDGTARKYDLSKAVDIVSLIRTKDFELINLEVEKHVKSIVSSSAACKDFNCVFLFDHVNSLNRSHAEKIYSEIEGFKDRKDIILFLRSLGGRVEPAYLISKLCNRYKENKFIVAIPAEAKSAATLLSLGADEIHMGPMSELGPIDPQVHGLPLLSIPNALDKIAFLVEKYPGSASMFSDYLKDNLKIGILGYYDRIAESASQYAQRLLKGKVTDSSRTVEDLASHFTNHYKDHRFVIDVEESAELLGRNIIKDNTEIYKVGSRVLSFFNNFEAALFFSEINKKITFIGSCCECVVDTEDDGSDSSTIPHE